MILLCVVEVVMVGMYSWVLLFWIEFGICCDGGICVKGCWYWL